MKALALALAVMLPTAALADKCRGGFKWKIETVVVNGNKYQISPHRKLDCVLVNESRNIQILRGNPLAAKPPLPFDEMKAAVNKYLGRSCVIADPVSQVKSLPLNWHFRYSC